MKFTKKQVFLTGGKKSKAFKDIRASVTIRVNQKTYTDSDINKLMRLSLAIILAAIIVFVSHEGINEVLLYLNLTPLSTPFWFSIVGILFLLGIFLLLYTSSLITLHLHKSIWTAGVQKTPVYEKQGEKSSQEEKQDQQEKK